MDLENLGVAQKQLADAKEERSGQARATRHSRRRWLVHLGLLASLAAALGTLQLLHVHNAIHSIVGLVFAGFVIVHLAQRRHRLARMLSQMLGLRPRIAREVRLLASDAVLAVVSANVVVSGILGWSRGAPLALPLLPAPFDRWHLLSSIVLVAYLIVHVARRWKRLRRSTIR